MHGNFLLPDERCVAVTSSPLLSHVVGLRGLLAFVAFRLSNSDVNLQFSLLVPSTSTCTVSLHVQCKVYLLGNLLVCMSDDGDDKMLRRGQLRRISL